LSAVASLGASLQTVENAKVSFEKFSISVIKESESYQSLTNEMLSIDTEISTLISRISSLPPEYSTAAKNLTASLQTLRDRKLQILDSISILETKTEKSSSNSNMFVLMGGIFSIKPEIVMLILLIFLAAIIEAGALIMTSPNNVMGESPSSLTVESTRKESISPSMHSMMPSIDADMFLDTAKKESSDLPYLLGGNRTSEILGISYGEGRRLVQKLLREKRVEVFGKRLRLVEQKAMATS
jgi:hypothetical protein